MSRPYGAPIRRHRVPRSKSKSNYYGYGPMTEDAVSGFEVPKSLCVTQRGQVVDRRHHEGSRDRDEEQQ